ELLVAADLEVLEGTREGGQLAGRVRVALEEGAPVQRTEPHRSVLQRGGVAAEGFEPRLDRLRVLARLVEVLRVDVGQRRAPGEPRPPVEQALRLFLDRVRVGEVFPKLLVQ